MTAVAKKSAAGRTGKAVDIAKLPGLTKVQVAARLASKAKSGKVAEMSLRDAGIKAGQL
jgi:hypothetical protein